MMTFAEMAADFRRRCRSDPEKTTAVEADCDVIRNQSVLDASWISNKGKVIDCKSHALALLDPVEEPLVDCELRQRYRPKRGVSLHFARLDFVQSACCLTNVLIELAP